MVYGKASRNVCIAYLEQLTSTNMSSFCQTILMTIGVSHPRLYLLHLQRDPNRRGLHLPLHQCTIALRLLTLPVLPIAMVLIASAVFLSSYIFLMGQSFKIWYRQFWMTVSTTILYHDQQLILGLCRNNPHAVALPHRSHTSSISPSPTGTTTVTDQPQPTSTSSSRTCICSDTGSRDTD
jgi:hypothetical protein